MSLASTGPTSDVSPGAVDEDLVFTPAVVKQQNLDPGLTILHKMQKYFHLESGTYIQQLH